MFEYKKSICLLFLFGATMLHAQIDGNKALSALNCYASFLNESIHGMLIAHRLLENYNQELNKYVDLESYQINRFSNKDLPKNIFEDPENWFYEKSPYTLYEEAIIQSKNLPKDQADVLNKQMEILKRDIDGINRIRFTIPDYIKEHDLSSIKHLKEVYALLEEAVLLFDHFFEVQKKMEIILLANTRKFAKPHIDMLDVVKSMDKTWFATKSILRSIRAKKDENLSEQIKGINKEIAILNSLDLINHKVTSFSSKKNLQSWKLIKEKSQSFSKNATALLATAEVPKEYKLYGKFYYYHNAVLTTDLNRYGFGLAHEMNKIIDDIEIPILYRIEEPHFYRVIYPKKLKKDNIIESSDDNIVVAPTKLKDRTIVNSTRTITIDTTIFVIKLFDHKIQDGDIVSINFNGDWILEQHSLEGSATTLKLKLNESGKNYLLLHAENEGKRPPNTMAIEYTYKGKKQRITLSSNLSESEMIEILYDPK